MKPLAFFSGDGEDFRLVIARNHAVLEEIPITKQQQINMIKDLVKQIK